MRVSAQGPHRESPGRAGRPGHRRQPRQVPSQSPPPGALFTEMLKAARELLAVRSPLDAEIMVSEMLGTWWSQPTGAPRRGHPADLEELIGERLVECAAADGSPAALALLSGIACLGTPRQAALAERAALTLLEQGVPRPAWADLVGAVAVSECYLNSDRYGDQDEVVCTFSYAGSDRHALVLLIDYNAVGMLRDGWVTSQVGILLERGRESQVRPPDGTGQGGFRQLGSRDARRLLESALTMTQTAPGPPVSESFAAYHAFIRARVHALPPTGGTDVAALPAGSPAAMLATDGPGWPDAALQRQAWSADRRAMLGVTFLAADEAEGLSDRTAASRCTDHIISYGCDRDFGRPLRMSPAKVETFLLDWLPRKIMLTTAQQHAMPHVLAAWARWAGKRRGLPGPLIDETVEAVYRALGTFATVYRDPATFGLDAVLVARLLPDADLEALPRRAFAFPVLRGHYRGADLADLDPAEPAARRTLLAADHDDAHGRPLNEQHLARHLVLSDRLWRGDPPELWAAAQRMLDRGEDRHAVAHTLMYVIRDAGDDPRRLAAELADLP